MLSTLVSLILLLPVLAAKRSTSCADASIAAVRQEFQALNISTLIDLPFYPEVLFEISFPEPNAAPIDVFAGEQLTPSETTLAPAYSLCGNSRDDAGDGPFVIVGIDPDAPAQFAQVRHFLGGGFHLGPVQDGKQILVNNTPAVTEFIVPQPVPGTGLHRYIFLLFKESPGFRHQTLITPATSPVLFNLSTFVQATGLGSPLGGTVFLDGVV